jgi:spore coat polysaccharide biosynthesis predicted glycosyltransferase SpsG
LSLSSAKRRAWRVTASVDAGGHIGFGHLKRCLAIGTQVRARGGQVEFQLGGELASACEVIERAGFCCVRGATADESSTVVLVDRIHADTLHDLQGLERDIQRWRGKNMRIALLDGTGKASLRYQRPDLKVDLLIAPYAGESGNEARCCSILAGAGYAPLGSEYERLPPRMTRPTAQHILVSCGGCDTSAVTAAIMRALAAIENRQLTIRIVLGPGFTTEYRASLMEICQTSDHRIEFVRSPDSLVSLMRWCDLAIATSGLTKYELAATGTPAVLISPDYVHAEVNKPFATLGTAVDLGTAAQLTDAALVSSIWALLNNPERRSSMSRAGMRAVDGAGAARTADALRELAHAQT